MEGNNKKILEKIKKKKFIIFLIVILVLKIIIVSVQPIYAKYSMKYDDQLMANMANNILEGKWLGKYDSFTLIKGVFTPLFMALLCLLNIPFLIGKEIFYGIACIIFVVIINKKIKSKAELIIIYIALLMNPIEYSSELCRLYRDGIYMSLILYFLAFMIGLFLNRKEKIKKQIKYFIGTGISFCAIYLCREETIWLIPFILFVTTATILPNFMNKKIIMYMIPIFITILGINIVCCINYKFYGVYTLNQYWGKAFKSAYGALVRVIPEKELQRVPVTRETMNKLYDLSPKFNELKDFFEGESVEKWRFCGENIEGEINGGYFHWALMDAVASKGYYENAKSADEYYLQLANQINTLCDNKEIQCRNYKMIGNICYFDFKDILDVIKEVPETIKYQYSLDDVIMRVSNANDIMGLEDEQLKKQIFEKIAGEKIVGISTYRLRGNRWRLMLIEKIKDIYAYVNPYIFYISIVTFIIFVIYNIKNLKEVYEELIILISLLTLYISRIFIITFTKEIMFKEAINVSYLSSIYNVQYLFSIISILCFIKIIRKNSYNKKLGL